VKRYHYVTMHALTVCEMTQYLFDRDAYISADRERAALDQLYSKGYRWVRTDGDWAVFELEVNVKEPTAVECAVSEQ
jgi:hypothetical protein